MIILLQVIVLGVTLWGATASASNLEPKTVAAQATANPADKKHQVQPRSQRDHPYRPHLAHPKAQTASPISLPHEEGQLSPSHPPRTHMPSGDFLDQARPQWRASTGLNKADRHIVIAFENIRQARGYERTLTGFSYRLERRRALKRLGMVVSTLQIPASQTVDEALAFIQKEWPHLKVDRNTTYRPMGAQALPSEQVGLKGAAAPEPLRLGLLDGPVNIHHPALHPALAGRAIKVISLLNPDQVPAAGDHATALASLIMGRAELGGEALLTEGMLVDGVVFYRTAQGVETRVENLLAGLDRLMAEDVDVIMMSLGGRENRLLHQAVQTIWQQGIPLVAAAGNGSSDESVLYPAAYEEVIAVTAVDQALRPYRHARRGKQVEIAAPGVDLKAAYGTSGYRYVSGTSYAVPYVAVALALWRRAGLSALEGRKKLCDSAIDLGVPGRDEVFGCGLLRYSH